MATIFIDKKTALRVDHLTEIIFIIVGKAGISFEWRHISFRPVVLI
jgi:hypothetical protein